DAMERIFPMLTEEEQSLYRRGRNAGHGKNTPKSASVIEYRRATGFETVFGALWLKGETRRAKELIILAFPGLA
ncbi:MAG: ribonuclease III, partial [Clostridia bacterium]|nr:ribonuclease III [Clostridia bacterium]